MNKIRGIAAILFAIALLVFLFVAWDFLGGYYMTLKILPNVPLIGARLFVGLGALGMVISGVQNLRGGSRKAKPADQQMSQQM